MNFLNKVTWILILILRSFFPFAIFLTACEEGGNQDSPTEISPVEEPDNQEPDDDSREDEPSIEEPPGVEEPVSPDSIFEIFSQGLNEARNFPQLLELNDGRLFIFGGTRQSGLFLKSGEVFDPATGNRIQGGTANSNFYNPALSLLPDGRVLIFAGNFQSSSFISYANAPEIYDPVANTFTPTLNLMNQTRGGVAYTTLNDGRIFMAGGYQNCSFGIHRQLGFC